MKNNNLQRLYKSKTITDLNTSKMHEIYGGSTTFFVDWLQDKVDDAMEEMSQWI